MDGTVAKLGRVRGGATANGRGENSRRAATPARSVGSANFDRPQGRTSWATAAGGSSNRNLTQAGVSAHKG